VHVAVVIVAYRNAEDVARCLGALTASTHADFEVVICENGGPAAYEALCAQVPSKLPGSQAVKRVAAPAHPGFAGGVNVGIRETPQADAWWILNPDTEPAPRALARMLERLQAGDCDAVGNSLHFPDGRVQSHGGRWRMALARAVSLGYGTPVDASVDAAAVERRQNYLNGASMLVGRAFVERAGLMREDYFLYCEEVEWCLRALGRGLRLGFAPGAAVVHHQGAATGNQGALANRSRLAVYLGERNRILLTRDVRPTLLPVAVPAALGLLALRYLRVGAWAQFGYALEGWLAGLRGERGPPRFARSGDGWPLDVEPEIP
jgi:GT2 family glycosyltransferase